MKLKRVRTLPHVKLVGRVPGDLHEALVGYAEYYRTVHGDTIEVWPLMVQILRTFVDDDREFHAWRRHGSGAAVGVLGERMESRDG
jgi:hypothetical protein